MNLVLVATVAFGGWAALSFFLLPRGREATVPVESRRAIEARRAAQKLR